MSRSTSIYELLFDICLEKCYITSAVVALILTWRFLGCLLHPQPNPPADPPPKGQIQVASGQQRKIAQVQAQDQTIPQ